MFPDEQEGLGVFDGIAQSVCPELPFENSVCCGVCSADLLHFRKFPRTKR